MSRYFPDEHPAGDPFEAIATQDELDADIRSGRMKGLFLGLAVVNGAALASWVIYRVLTAAADWLAGVVTALV